MKKTLIIASLILLPLVSNANFDTNLSYGTTNPKVIELQEFLTEQGVYSGPITGNFYSLTLAAVKTFQAREHIRPVSGFFGPLTRGRANEILNSVLSVSDQAQIEEVGEIQATSTPVTNQQVVEEVRELKKTVETRLGSSNVPSGEAKRYTEISYIVSVGGGTLIEYSDSDVEKRTVEYDGVYVYMSGLGNGDNVSVTLKDQETKEEYTKTGVAPDKDRCAAGSCDLRVDFNNIPYKTAIYDVVVKVNDVQTTGILRFSVIEDSTDVNCYNNDLTRVEKRASCLGRLTYVGVSVVKITKQIES